MPFPGRPNPVLANWHYLYTHPARAEEELEPYIAKLGVPYRYQHIVWKYIIDFALFTSNGRYAIELDGPDHDKPAKKKKDEERTAYLEKNGWRVIRFRNTEVYDDPQAVMDRIELAINNKVQN